MSNAYTIAVVGEGGVGKSCLTTQFLSRTFTPEYDPTVGDCYQKEITFEEQAVTLSVLDTAGQDDYLGMLESILGQAQGYLIVYSITSRPTLERTPEFVELVKRVNDGELPPAILVGNKCDLEITREVTKADGKAMADRLQMEWAEASAKNRINSDEVFYDLLRRVIDYTKAEELAASKVPKKKCVIL